MDIEGDIILREMDEADCKKLEEAFAGKVHRTAQLYTSYLEAGRTGKRNTIVAYCKGQIAGYATILWESEYEGFEEEGIPEITDIEVLDTFKSRGIATKLMDELERRALERSDYCGAGVGLADPYTAAQRLYAKRGYQPDGKGIFYIEHARIHEQLEIDDNQGLMMIKKL